MPMAGRDIAGTLLLLLEEIKEKELPVLVEGHKDKKALQHFGIGKEHITTLSVPLYKFIERHQGKEVAVLTDLDRHGRKLYGKVRHDGMHFGVKINNRLRHFLLRETELSHIEGLPRYMSNMAGENSGRKRFYHQNPLSPFCSPFP